MRTLVHVWTAPKSAGGVPLGSLPVHLVGGSLRTAEALTGRQGVSVSVPAWLARDAGVAEGTWLRTWHPLRGVREWIVSTITDGDGAGRDTVGIEASPLRHILTLRGRIRSLPTIGSPTTTFTPGARSVRQLIDLYFDPTRGIDGLSFVSVRDIEYAGTIDVGTIASWTYGQLFDAIAQRTGYEWEEVNLGTDGYALDLVRRRGSTAATRRLSPTANLERVDRTRSLVAGVTVVDLLASDGTPIGEPCWRVRQISGSAGAWWVALEDPAGGPDVIREDGQLVGAVLVPRDGAPLEILDARASDSAVQLATIPGVVVGSLVTLWETAEGRLISSLTSPSGLGSSRGRIVQTVQGASPYTSRNLAPDPLLRGGFEGWELYDPATSYDEQTETYARTDPARVAGAAAGGESSGVTSVDVDGLPAGAQVRNGDVVQVEGVRYTADGVAVVSATGTATVPIDGTIASTLAGDTSLTRRLQAASAPLAVRTNGTNTAGASSLTLKDLPPSIALASGDKLEVALGGEGVVTVTEISGTGPAYTLSVVPLPFDISSGVVLRVTENQFSGDTPYWGGLYISAISGGVPLWALTITPLPVDIPDGTVLQISETRRQAIGNRTQIVTYTATVSGAVSAGSTTVYVDAPGRTEPGVFAFLSASAPFTLGGDTRVIAYDFTLTSTYTAGGTTIDGTATRAAVGWSFLTGAARYNGTTLRTYTITGTPSLWSTAGVSTATITGTLFETLAAETVLRWSRSGTILGDLVVDSSASGGGNTIALRGGAYVSYVTIGTTFELPSFQVTTTAATTADGSGAATLTVTTTPSAIANDAAVTLVRCPDLADDQPGGPNVTRLRGVTGTGTVATAFSSAQYRQAGVFAHYTAPQRVIVPAGETRTIRAALAYTLWAASASRPVNCRMVLWNVTGTPAILAEVSIDTAGTTTIPFTADLETVTHGEITLSAVLSATTRCVLSIYPYSTDPLSFLFARSVNWWVGEAGVPPMDGADNNALWHKGQDRLEVGKSTASYRLALSGRRLLADDPTAPLTLGAPARLVSPWLEIDEVVRIVRVETVDPGDDVTIECDVTTPLLSEV